MFKHKEKKTESFVLLLKAIKCVKNIYYSKYNMLLGHLFIKKCSRSERRTMANTGNRQKIVSNDDNKCQIKRNEQVPSRKCETIIN